MSEADEEVAAFRKRLRDLYSQVGEPPYAKLCEQSEHGGLLLSTSTIGDLLSTSRASVPRWKTVEAFVSACVRYASTRRPPLALPDADADLDIWEDLHTALPRSSDRRPVDPLRGL